MQVERPNAQLVPSATVGRVAAAGAAPHCPQLSVGLAEPPLAGSLPHLAAVRPLLVEGRL